MKAIARIDGISCTYTKLENNSSQRWIVLIHGIDADGSKCWGDFAYQLCSCEFNVLYLDLPGFGQSETPHEIWNTRRYALFLEKFLNVVSIKPLLLAGHGFGAAAALHYVAVTRNTKGLILLAPTFSYPQVKNKSIFHTGVSSIRQNVIRISQKLRVIGPATEVFHSFNSLLGRDYQREKSTMKSIIKHLTKENHLHLLSKMAVPTLVLWGSRDLYSSVTNAEEIMAKLPKKASNTLKIIDGAGHTLYSDDPTKVATEICHFFEENRLNFVAT